MVVSLESICSFLPFLMGGTLRNCSTELVAPSNGEKSEYRCGFCDKPIMGEGFVSPIGEHYCNLAHWSAYCED